MTNVTTTKSNRRSILSVLVVMSLVGTVLAFLSAPAYAATFTVDDDGVECPSPDFSTIQAAVNAASPGDTITVCAGTYNEDVLVNKADLNLLGAGMDVTTIIGPIGGDGRTVGIAASGVVVDGFTITRDGNNTTDWNDAGLNFAGVGVQGQTVNVELRNSRLTGNRTAIDINNSNGNNIHNNVIDDNHTGMIFRNQTDNTVLTENAITNNRTVGVLFLDASGGTNSPVQTALNSTFSNNNISGNWYGEIVDRQSGGSLPAPGTTNLKDFSANWFGTTSPVVTTNNSAEPAYTGHIPVAYGGSATDPGGQPDIAGPASANFDFTPLLTSGADTNLAEAGFQGDFSDLLVHSDGAQVGGTGRVQEGVDLVDGSTVQVGPGTYNETVTLPAGANDFTMTGTDANDRPLITDGIVIGAGMTDLTLKDLRVTRTTWNASNVAVIRNLGIVTNMEFDNVEVDGQSFAFPAPPTLPTQGFGVIGGNFNGAINIHDSQFVNIAAWAVFDTRSGSGGAGAGSVNTSFNFSDNYLSNNAGHVNSRAAIGFETPTVTISGNTVEDYPATPTNNTAAVFKVFYAVQTDFTDNTISNIGSLQTDIGGFPYGAGLMPRNAGTLTVTGNTFEDSVQGVAFEPRSTTTNGLADGVIAGGTISGNHFLGNTQGIFVTATNHANSTLGNLDINYNRFSGNATPVDNDSATSLNAENNWWGCNAGPGFLGCDLPTGLVDFDPWLVLDVSADPTGITAGNDSTITADLTDNSDGGDSGGFVPDGTPVDFATDKGTVAPPSTTTTNGLATSTLMNNGCCSGLATVDATVDNETQSTQVDFGTTETVDDGEEVTTDPADPADSEPSSGDEVHTNVTAPNDNTTVSVVENEDTHTTPDPSGYSLLDLEVDITVTPDGTPSNPIRIEFQIDESKIPGGTDPQDIAVFRNGVLVPTCSSPHLVQAVPDPCVQSRTSGPGAGDVTIVIYTSQASIWNFGVANPGACTITGTNGDDVIDGTPGDDVICGLDGNDIIDGRGGNDIIYGGDGKDMLYGSAGQDELHGENGNDELFGDGAADELYGGPGQDSLYGGAGGDILYGQGDDDLVIGNTGNDTMFGGDGHDEMRGWGGTDYMEGNDGNDLLMGHSGIDALIGGEGHNRILGGGGADFITAGDGNDEINGGEDGDTIHAGGGTNLVIAGEGDDFVTAGSGTNEINLGGGNDTYEGGNGFNRVFGNGGDDDITTGASGDVINSGEGVDTIDAGDGNNSINAGGGDDNVTTGVGNDEIHGGDGNDTINAGDGLNVINGGEGNDAITTGLGNDEIFAGGGNDTVFAGGGADHVRGGAGLDSLNGEAGNDELFGGPDDDTIDGGPDSDTCYQDEGTGSITNCEAP